MRKKVLCILRCVTLGVLLGALIDFLAFTVIPLREAIYGWLGYYMTYFPAIAILVGGLAGLVAAFRILSMKRYATITGILLVILVVSSAVYFINATGDDFEEKTGGLHQIKHIGIPANSPSEAAVQLDLIHHSRQNRLPKVRILPDNKVYKGGRPR